MPLKGKSAPKTKATKSSTAHTEVTRPSGKVNSSAAKSKSKKQPVLSSSSDSEEVYMRSTSDIGDSGSEEYVTTKKVCVI